MATYLVTGVTGFVGKALALRLVSDGHIVRGVSRSSNKELVHRGVRLITHDLSNFSDLLLEACDGVEAVFHVAAKVDMWGRYNDFYASNVLATRHLLDACKKMKVPYFIYTSSPSVIAGSRDLCGVDESIPYPNNYLASYPSTKALAEQEVLTCGKSELIKSIALRPHLIFGPGDTNLIPTILERAKAGKLLRVGEGTNLTDLTYIDDCVEAHVCALRALKSNSELSGRVYFISQGEPVNLWEWVDKVLTLSGLPKVNKSLPKWLAYSIAGILEGICRILPGNPEPLLTRFLVCEMATSHYFNISAAKRDLGFNPSYSIDEALDLTFSYQENSKNLSQLRVQPL